MVVWRGYPPNQDVPITSEDIVFPNHIYIPALFFSKTNTRFLLFPIPGNQNSHIPHSGKEHRTRKPSACPNAKHPILKADAIKFVSSFRLQIPRDRYARAPASAPRIEHGRRASEEGGNQMRVFFILHLCSCVPVCA